MRGPRRPQRLLRFKRLNNCVVIDYVDSSIQGAKSGLMRKQLRKRDLFFAGLGKLRPELCDPLVDVDVVFLQHMQKTGAADSLCRRPYQHERVSRPRFFATRVAEPAVKIENRFFVLPNRNSGSELAKPLKVFLEQWLQSLAKFISV
jgi:hypothetical protein